MQRKNVLLVGALLALILLVGGAVVLLMPRQDTGPGPRPSQPTVAANAPFTAEPGDTVITLTWQPVQGAVGYAIYRDGNSTPLNSAPITATSYSDIGLSNGRTYTYTVSIMDAGGKPGKSLAETKATPKSR